MSKGQAFWLVKYSVEFCYLYLDHLKTIIGNFPCKNVSKSLKCFTRHENDCSITSSVTKNEQYHKYS